MITQLETYYEKAGVIVRDSCLADIEYLQNNLKQSDVDEVWASHHKLPSEALEEGLRDSTQCLSVIIDGKAVAMFGVVKVLGSSSEGLIWFLSSEEIFTRVKFEFLRHSSGFVGFFFHRDAKLQKLFNFVDARNKISIRWLSKIGAIINHPALPFGAEQLPFYYFEFRRL